MIRRILMLLGNDFAPDPRVYKEARTLVAAGYEVGLLCMSRAPERYAASQRIDGIDVARFDVGKVETGRIASVYRALRGFYRQALAFVAAQGVRWDAVHAHDLDMLELGVRLKRRWDCPLVYDSHELFCGYTGRPPVDFGLWVLEAGLLAPVDAIIHAAPWRQRLFGRAHPLARVKPQCSLQNFPARVADFHRAAPSANAPLVFQYQGVINADRCLGEIVEAFGLLSAAERARVRLVVFGTENDYAKGLGDLARRRGVSGIVDFRGFLRPDSLAMATRETHVGFVSLRLNRLNARYPSPNKLYDYMAAKNLVIAPNTHGVADIVREGRMGWLCDFEDPDSIACAIRRALAEPAIGEMQERAFTLHRRQYNWQQQEPVLLGLYRELVGCPTRYHP